MSAISTDSPGAKNEANAGLRWQAVLARDSRHDGIFFYAVATTGVFCRPSCSSRRPRRENVLFFDQPQEATRAGFRPCLRCRPLSAPGSSPQLEQVRQLCRYIEQHLDEPLTLSRLGSAFHQSPFHLQRSFKAVLGITPRQYADACRLHQFKLQLQSGTSVTTALYDAGYSSSSRLYERAAAQLGMAPDKYRRGAIAVPIRYTITDSALGKVLIGATPKGICAIRFGNSEEELEQLLKREFPFAMRKHDEAGLKDHVAALRDYLSGQRLLPALPFDIQATAFQRRVWEHLQRIPAGETRSYSEVARDIGQPTATRAVAHACASNPVALVIPCHRVVRGDGSLGGYRWGTRRKQRLLEMERAAARQ
ncbi:MAG TPA: bifunctional DNA-binding transcriptional regulator/O6-methylguanine-DNA methyltransferase Ada [Terriglobales bacterium]|nr:bifunctional DNA-binding transcriptional regulator/O6-methylguanine-DNA methyltransferase Ada [Terriglobales bacterium]